VALSKTEGEDSQKQIKIASDLEAEIAQAMNRLCRDKAKGRSRKRLGAHAAANLCQEPQRNKDQPQHRRGSRNQPHLGPERQIAVMGVVPHKARRDRRAMRQFESQRETIEPPAGQGPSCNHPENLPVKL
jgi:hypothetical protein